MTQTDNVVNLSSSTAAPLQNVALCNGALERALDRPAHLPGLVAFYGPSGWGKSTAAAYCANRHRAYYVECKSSWTKKALLNAVLTEMGVAPAKTLYEMADQISEQLVLSGRPLIVDEMDHIVSKKAVEVIRDIYEGSNAAILLIGEELLPAKLREWERFHNRMLAWVPAQPCDLDDTRQLARLYCREVTIHDDLLAKIQEVSRGAARRICVNVENVRQAALGGGLAEVDLATWGDQPLYSGEAPKRRV
ncbi:AAA family ATPase [Alkalilimnicola sp. S0819]|uniref:AAA family ATPase n=1 Tax=Alkalilimnicola sp. S0819 TaxID=2613922 RepID=UPI0012616A65|nr:ATP-binding protein [Alkalilimnicola sp. S0819]KAB7624353.1 ATP-binding protein [Alkalilimnicola sp. S0819]MPQ16179.1 AAA family ATPase [Alkalilimnicola sp. S0819]